MEEFTKEVIEIISSIPKGKIMTYGGIAKIAGNGKAARQVTRILHIYSTKYRLPWHRIINSQGKISLPKEMGGEEQKIRLISEGVIVSEANRIDLKKYLWVE